MATLRKSLDDRHIVDLYLSGMEAHEVCDSVGISSSSLYRVLRRNGVESRGKRIAMPEGTVERYEDGTSVLQLSKELGVSRSTVTRWLIEAGCELRGRSDANLVRVSKMTPEERASQAAAAHAAVRGRVRTDAELIERAKDVERRANGHATSAGEALMLGWLDDRQLRCITQRAVGRYNLDIAIGDRFGVEVFGGSWHAMPERRRKETGRLEYLLSRGISIIYVWDTHFMPMVERCADEAVAFYEMVRENPSARGQYRVLRGDGELVASGRDHADESAFVLPAQNRH